MHLNHAQTIPQQYPKSTEKLFSTKLSLVPKRLGTAAQTGHLDSGSDSAGGNT